MLFLLEVLGVFLNLVFEGSLKHLYQPPEPLLNARVLDLLFLREWVVPSYSPQRFQELVVVHRVLVKALDWLDYLEDILVFEEHLGEFVLVLLGAFLLFFFLLAVLALRVRCRLLLLLLWQLQHLRVLKHLAERLFCHLWKHVCLRVRLFPEDRGQKTLVLEEVHVRLNHIRILLLLEEHVVEHHLEYFVLGGSVLHVKLLLLILIAELVLA